VLADVLEIYHLCMLLGFAGRYSIGGRGDLRNMIDATAAKIRRIRGDVGGISPAWTLPHGVMPVAGGDPHLLKFLLGAVVCLLLALTLFFSFHFILGKDVSAVQEIATKGRS
jgi:type VI secretion system protein ImpK